MTKYVALLRGINVGGKNAVSMPLLKSAFENAGFCNISTYINSGNLLFSDNCENIPFLKDKCEQIIKDTFNLNIPVVIISENTLEDTLAHIPSWWDNDKEFVHNAIFLIPPTTVEFILEKIGETNPEFELVSHHESVIFWSAPRATFSRTKMTKMTSTSDYNKFTVRNANTTKKLLQLIKNQA